MKEKWKAIIIRILFFAGLLCLNYPSLAMLYSQMHQGKVISDYSQKVENVSDEESDNAWKAARKYNQKLARQTVSSVVDAFTQAAEKEDTEYKNLLNLSGDGIMGMLEIPKINVYLPIFHGTEETELRRGVGHILGTSLPVGGTGTHVALAGHNGLASAELLTELDQLEEGDEFYLHVLNQHLAYEVDQILIVLPEEISNLNIDRKQDYVTLVTCTPYGINSHRLLVRGKRTTYQVAENETEQAKVQKYLYQWILEQKVLLISVAGILIWCIVCIIRSIKKRIRFRKCNEY